MINDNRSPRPILSIEGLTTGFSTDFGTITAVNGLDLHLEPSQTIALVGESGCGKSVTALSIMRLIPSPPGKITSGKVFFNGRDLIPLTEKEMQKIRGEQISMIFQEPMTSLNPVFTIGEQISEVFRYHRNMKRSELKEQSIEILKQVGIPSPDRRYYDYPHQLSGGMRQRVMIAMALALSPRIMIADEPTTALDVTIQASILDLMEKIKEERAMSIIVITHDLSIVKNFASKISVMYAGRIVEDALVDRLFKTPLHPYTVGLLKSIPSHDNRLKRLYSIPGNVPKLFDLPPGCSFNPRCPEKMKRCVRDEPPMFFTQKNHAVRCWLYDK